jgi:hypothetical protein
MPFSPKKPEPGLDTQTSKTYRNQSSHQQPELPELVATNFKPRTRLQARSVAKPKTTKPGAKRNSNNPKHSDPTRPDQTKNNPDHTTHPDQQPECKTPNSLPTQF